MKAENKIPRDVLHALLPSLFASTSADGLAEIGAALDRSYDAEPGVKLPEAKGPPLARRRRPADLDPLHRRPHAELADGEDALSVRLEACDLPRREDGNPAHGAQVGVELRDARRLLPAVERPH